MFSKRPQSLTSLSTQFIYGNFLWVFPQIAIYRIIGHRSMRSRSVRLVPGHTACWQPMRITGWSWRRGPVVGQANLIG
jgi:hypothetical protein